MKISFKKLSILSLLLGSFLLNGCASKNENFFIKNNNAQKNVKTLLQTNSIIPFKKIKTKKYILMDGKTIKEAIDELNNIYGTNYFYEGEDIVLPKSNFKVYTPNDLKYYVDKTTKYNLILKPSYNKRLISKVYLMPKGIKTNYLYVSAGQTNLFNELFKLNHSGYNVIIGKDVENKNINISIKTKNPVEFMKAVCLAGDVWCDVDANKNINVHKYKILTVDATMSGSVTFQIGNSGGNNTNTNGGDTTNNGGASPTAGITYKINGLSYEDVAKTISSYFDDYDMIVGKNGYYQFNVTPSQYKKIKEYFAQRDKRNKLVNVEIRLIRIDLKNEFKYGINWNSFIKVISKSVDGLQILQKNQLVDPNSDMGGFISIKNKAYSQAIENYIAQNQNNLTLDQIEQLRQKEYTGLIGALQSFGNVTTVDEYFNQVRTGNILPFARYEVVRYFTVGATGGDNGTQPVQTYQVNSDTVGFRGSLLIIKRNKGYDVNGYIEQSTISGFTTIQTQDGILKAPNIVGKVTKINTHLSGLNRTIILGGFVSKGLTDDTSGTPGLQKLPIFGYLFKDKHNLKQNSQFLILITLKPASEGKIQ